MQYLILLSVFKKRKKMNTISSWSSVVCVLSRFSVLAYEKIVLPEQSDQAGGLETSFVDVKVF
jgi:hypothetical protein